MTTGTWIAFEGLDGCGKSTQAGILAEAIGGTLTREPGASALGAAIRHIVLHGDVAVGGRAEALLFAADRAQHLEEVVMPAISGGTHVVSDRSVWSSVVYQGVGRGLGLDTVIEVNQWACAGMFPDIVVYLRSDVDAALARIGSAPDRIEAAGADFHERARGAFEDLASRYGWIVVEAGSIDDMAAHVRQAVMQRLGTTM